MKIENHSDIQVKVEDKLSNYLINPLSASHDNWCTGIHF